MDLKAVKRHQRRMEVFIAEGLTEREALDLADKMYDRDLDPDGRRLCFECANYTVKKTCSKLILGGKEQRPLRFVLQRCELFTSLPPVVRIPAPRKPLPETPAPF